MPDRFLSYAALAAAPLAIAAHVLAGLSPLAAAIVGIAPVMLALVLGRTRPPPAAPAVPDTDAAPVEIDALLAALPHPMLIVERGQIIRMNPAAVTMLGNHAIGQDVRLAIRHPAAAALLAGDAAGGPVTLPGLGHPDRRWELAVAPLGSGLRLVRLVDRSDAHAAERMRVDFVANASHELRTPLAALLGYIETLDDGAADDRATRTRFLKIMFAEARRMQRLIDDLISLSRIEADRFTPPQSAIALPPLVEEVCATLGGDRARIEIAIGDDLPPVTGDRAQLSQIVHNLIGNALKYARAGSSVRVTLAPHAGGMVRLSVADQGDGIAAEHIPRLTERFYRVDPSRSRAAGGTGLGLAIVKHIVERHRGQLDIASRVGDGTTVTVTLPAADPVSSKRHAHVTESDPTGPSAEPATRRRTRQGARP